MFSLRNRFGIPGVISVIALVFAMTGGAFAAKYVITSPKQIKPSVLKKLKGKRGLAGPAGAAGLQGAVGPAGANGKDGAPGAPGKDGAKGATGLKGATGATGPTGQTGFTKTLPSGETLSGSWAIGMLGADPKTYNTTEEEKKVTLQTVPFGTSPISFGIPLSEPPTFRFPSRELKELPAPEDCSALAEPEKKACEDGNAEKEADKAKKEAELATECPGSPAAPDAAPGFLCLYDIALPVGPLNFTPGNRFQSELTLTASGMVLIMSRPSTTTTGMSTGSWAVTAH